MCEQAKRKDQEYKHNILLAAFNKQDLIPKEYPINMPRRKHSQQSAERAKKRCQTQGSAMNRFVLNLKLLSSVGHNRPKLELVLKLTDCSDSTCNRIRRNLQDELHHIRIIHKTSSAKETTVELTQAGMAARPHVPRITTVAELHALCKKFLKDIGGSAKTMQAYDFIVVQGNTPTATELPLNLGSRTMIPHRPPTIAPRVPSRLQA